MIISSSQVSFVHLLPITRSPATFAQFNDIRTKTFAHRTQTLEKTGQYRLQMSQSIENYFTQTTSLIEDKVNAISSSDSALRSLIAAEPRSECITNLIAMTDSTIENAGYGASVCISNGDGIVSAAAKSFYVVLDVDEREINLELVILTNGLTGRNVFTQSKPIITRVTNLYNAKVTNYQTYLTDILAKFNEVTAVFDEQAALLNTCLSSYTDFVTTEIARLTNSLATCQNLKPKA